MYAHNYCIYFSQRVYNCSLWTLVLLHQTISVMLFQVEAGDCSKTEDRLNWKTDQRAVPQLEKGVLNDPQLILGFKVLFVFYVCLTAWNTFLAEREETALTCDCESLHPVYFRCMVTFSASIWGVVFFLIAIWDACKFWRFQDKHKHPENYKSDMSSQSSDTAEHDTSFLDRAIDSVEDGVQIVMEIPARLLLRYCRRWG